MNIPEQFKYCLYARKSSESDERQAMSIDSQLTEMRSLANHAGLVVVSELQESHSAKDSGKRPIYNQMLEDVKSGKFNAILTWAPDRLSRNAGDLGALVDLMDQGKLLQIKTYSQTFTNSPNEKFLLMILCSQAKLENDNKSINVKRGIKAKCEMGWRPGVAPLGYINRAFNGIKDIVPDPERAPFIAEVFKKASEGWSGRRIKFWLDEQGFKNRSGGPVNVSQVFTILINPFYYGEFQYPESSSGKWYKGAHTPLINKGLYDIVQQRRGANKGIWGSKQFIFKDILICGSCRGNISGQEKFKLLGNGSHARYIYYNCNRMIDPTCKERYISETQVCAALLRCLLKHPNLIPIDKKLSKVVERHHLNVKSILTYYTTEIPEEDSTIEYFKYTLTHGTQFDRATLAKNINYKFVLRNKSIELV